MSFADDTSCAKSDDGASCASSFSLVITRRKSSKDGLLTSDVPLATLQGEWVAGAGGEITVDGEQIFLNGARLDKHCFRLDDTGEYVTAIAQRKGENGYVRRYSIGGEFATARTASSEGIKTPVAWVLYGSRESEEGTQLVWREDDRETVWTRGEPPIEELLANFDFSIPITLETMQGEWVNSVGAKISVDGTAVSLNQMRMAMHPVVVGDDGNVASIGKLWQMVGWDTERPGSIEFREAPSRDVMEFARSVIWTRASPEYMKKWVQQMKGLGYAGSSANCGAGRGVEGSLPGSCDAKARSAPMNETIAATDAREVLELNELILKWKEPGRLAMVTCRSVVPDFTNRAQTGISVEHCHYVALSILNKGFQTRVPGTSHQNGHDIPVVCREGAGTKDSGEYWGGLDALKVWMARVAKEPGFPPVRAVPTEAFFTSLGNGHFFQALNLHDLGCGGLNEATRYGATRASDPQLRAALDAGVPSIVLSSRTPREVRARISLLLNSKFEFRWTLNANCELEVEETQESGAYVSQFERIAKVLDAQELNCLVRQTLGVKDSDRIGR